MLNFTLKPGDYFMIGDDIKVINRVLTAGTLQWMSWQVELQITAELWSKHRGSTISSVAVSSKNRQLHRMKKKKSTNIIRSHRFRKKISRDI